MKTELNATVDYINMFIEEEDELNDIVKGYDIPRRRNMTASELVMLSKRSNQLSALMLAYKLGFMRGERYGKRKKKKLS